MNWPDDFMNQVICGDNLSVTKEIPDEGRNYRMDSRRFYHK